MKKTAQQDHSYCLHQGIGVFAFCRRGRGVATLVVIRKDSQRMAKVSYGCLLRVRLGMWLRIGILGPFPSPRTPRPFGDRARVPRWTNSASVCPQTTSRSPRQKPSLTQVGMLRLGGFEGLKGFWVVLCLCFNFVPIRTTLRSHPKP